MAYFPCGHSDHWTNLTLILHVADASFSRDPILDAAGEPDTDGEWVITDDEPCITILALHTHEEEAGEDEAPYRYTHVVLRSYRSDGQRSQPENGAPTHEQLLVALDSALDEAVDVVPMTAVCEMEFEGPPRWQIPILARPPELGDAQEDLGSISLAGVVLQFSQSSIGLVRAAMETGIDAEESSLRLMYRLDLDRENLPELFEGALRRAEELASLFIQPRPEGSET